MKYYRGVSPDSAHKMVIYLGAKRYIAPKVENTENLLALERGINDTFPHNPSSTVIDFIGSATILTQSHRHIL